MVDLVQLVGTDQRFALKSLEKREMLERNKVGAPSGCPGSRHCPSRGALPQCPSVPFIMGLSAGRRRLAVRSAPRVLSAPARC